MPMNTARDTTGRFTGRLMEDTASRVRAKLTIDKPVTATWLAHETGLTRYQVMHAISYLRRVAGHDCIITKGNLYSLAEDAQDVRDYAEKQARNWLSSIETMRLQMKLAQQILRGGHADSVAAAAEILDATSKIVARMLSDDKKQRKPIKA